MQKHSSSNGKSNAVKNNFLPAMLFTVVVIGVLIMLYVINAHAATNTKTNAATKNNCSGQTAKNISCSEKQDDSQSGTMLLRLQHFIE